MKGIAEIKLFDDDGNVVLEHVEENMITSAVSDILSHNPFGVADYTNYIFPIFTMMNGVYLFKNTIPENVNTVNIPTGNYPVGWAGSETNTDATVLKRGSYNAVESEITEHACKFVWYFKNTEANGEINSLSLTSGLIGNSSKLGPDNKFLQVAAVNHPNEIVGCQAYNYEKGLFFKLTPITAEFTDTDNASITVLTGVTINVYRRACYNIPFTQGNIAKTMTNIDNSSFLQYKPKGTFTVNFTTPIPVYKYIYAGNLTSLFSINYDPKTDKIDLYGLNSTNNNVYKYQITPVYTANQVTSFAVSENCLNITYGTVDGFSSGAYFYQNIIPVVDNVMYLPYVSGAGYVDDKNGDYRFKFYRINLTTGIMDTVLTEDNVAIIVNPAAGLVLAGEHSYYNPYFSVVDGKINRHSNNNSYRFPSHDIGHNFILSQNGNIFINMGYLASINNLTSSITKDSSTSMQVTYTISDV